MWFTVKHLLGLKIKQQNSFTYDFTVLLSREQIKNGGEKVEEFCNKQNMGITIFPNKGGEKKDFCSCLPEI